MEIKHCSHLFPKSFKKDRMIIKTFNSKAVSLQLMIHTWPASQTTSKTERNQVLNNGFK